MGGGGGRQTIQFIYVFCLKGVAAKPCVCVVLFFVPLVLFGPIWRLTKFIQFEKLEDSEHSRVWGNGRQTLRFRFSMFFLIWSAARLPITKIETSNIIWFGGHPFRQITNNNIAWFGGVMAVKPCYSLIFIILVSRQITRQRSTASEESRRQMRKVDAAANPPYGFVPEWAHIPLSEPKFHWRRHSTLAGRGVGRGVGESWIMVHLSGSKMSEHLFLECSARQTRPRLFGS